MDGVAMRKKPRMAAHPVLPLKEEINPTLPSRICSSGKDAQLPASHGA
jgi:hypothetical protein